MSPSRSYRIRIILTWLLLLAGSIIHFVTRPHLAGLIVLLVGPAIRHLTGPPFPKPSLREQACVLVCILLCFASKFLAPPMAGHIVSGLCLVVALFVLGSFDYRLYTTVGSSSSSVPCTYSDADGKV